MALRFDFGSYDGIAEPEASMRAAVSALRQGLSAAMMDRARTLLFLTGAATDRSLADLGSMIDSLEEQIARVLSAGPGDCWEGLGCGQAAGLIAWNNLAKGLADQEVTLMQFIDNWGLVATLKKIGQSTLENLKTEGLLLAVAAGLGIYAWAKR